MSKPKSKAGSRRPSRRDFLSVLSGLAALPIVQACTGGTGSEGSGTGEESETGMPDDMLPDYMYDGELGPETLFADGVASGDPGTDRVILWTRLSDDAGDAVVMVENASVFVEVSEYSDFSFRVAAQVHQANDDRDNILKLDLLGLEPDTTYYYRFSALGRTSPVGRTRTLPQGSVDRVRLAIASCSSYQHGYFHAYARIAQRADLSAVLHLGDYIYEYGPDGYGDFREHDPPHECLVLADYRQRYRQYRREPELAEVHRQHPFIQVWDDHEFANDAFQDGAENHTDGAEGDWQARTADAAQAFFEWQPVREQDPFIIYRTFAFGDLIDLFMLDTRFIGRSEQASSIGDDETINDPSRSLLGDTQAQWLEDGLAASSARWQVLGQQVMMGQFKVVGAPNADGGGVILVLDQWDGYGASRERLWQQVRDANVRNFVVLTGDIHSSWAMDLTEDPNNPDAYDPSDGSGALGVEFVTTSISSDFDFLSNSGVQSIKDANPHLRELDFENRGYLVLDVNTERVQGDWYYVDDVESTSGGDERWGFGYTCADMAAHLVLADDAAPSFDDAPELAP